MINIDDGYVAFKVSKFVTYWPLGSTACSLILGMIAHKTLLGFKEVSRIHDNLSSRVKWQLKIMNND